MDRTLKLVYCFENSFYGEVQSKRESVQAGTFCVEVLESDEDKVL